VAGGGGVVTGAKLVPEPRQASVTPAIGPVL
jgi:hypothetical protein